MSDDQNHFIQNIPVDTINAICEDFNFYYKYFSLNFEIIPFSLFSSLSLFLTLYLIAKHLLFEYFVNYFILT